jgi:hypothetical protein
MITTIDGSGQPAIADHCWTWPTCARHDHWVGYTTRHIKRLMDATLSTLGAARSSTCGGAPIAD